MINAFHKITIDFEYLNEIYTINSDPYKTLIELKEAVSKKIFPYPGDVHCFYRNIDLYEKEDEEIIKLFPHNSKLKIILRHPNQERRLTIRSYATHIKRPQRLSIITPKKNFKTINEEVTQPKSKTIRKKELIRLKSLPSITSADTKSRPNSNLEKHKIKSSKNNLDQDMNDNIKNNDLFYYLHKKQINQLKKLSMRNINKEINEIDENLNKFKSTKSDKFFTDKKELQDINFLLSSLKENSLKKLKLDDKLSLNYSKHKTNLKKNRPIKLKKLNISSDENFKSSSKKEKNEENNDNNDKENQDNRDNNDINNNDSSKDDTKRNDNNDKENINQINKELKLDENYYCPSCKNEIIVAYCMNCDEFKCKSCLDLCKNDEHNSIIINLEKDCLSNIIIYGENLLNKVDNNLEEILKYEKDLNIYDIKSFRDKFFEYINELFNIYNEIISILEKTYKEKNIKKVMDKYNLECNKTKEEINDIIKNAKSYLKSDNNIGKPKFKIMNMKYFFNLINEKEKSHNSLYQKMKIYSLNSNINLNMEKSFNDIENIIKAISNRENSFLLKDDLKNEYKKLIQNNMSKKDKKRLLLRRKTLSIKALRLPTFSPIKGDKVITDVNN